MPVVCVKMPFLHSLGSTLAYCLMQYVHVFEGGGGGGEYKSQNYFNIRNLDMEVKVELDNVVKDSYWSS